MGDGSSTGSGGGAASRFTRSRASVCKFDWRSRCFICGNVFSTKHRSLWSMVESSVGDDPDNPNMYVRVLQAAEARQDEDMMTRLQSVPNSDLVAIEARYHRKKSCYIKYISKSGVVANQKRTQQLDAHNASVRKLISELTSPILEHRNIFFLITMKKRFLEILADEGVDHPESYTYQHLKRPLKEWPKVAFIPQSGRCDLV
jgi:hypothetical protein